MRDNQRIARLSHEFGDRDLAERLVRARREVVQTVPDDLSQRHLAAIAAASAVVRREDVGVAPRQLLGTLFGRSAKLAVAIAATALVAVGALATSGWLPASAQDLVADAASHVGVELPRPEARGADGLVGTPLHPEVDGTVGPPPPTRGTDGRDATSGTAHPEQAPGADVRDRVPGADLREGTPGADVREETPGADAREETPGADAREGASDADRPDGGEDIRADDARPPRPAGPVTKGPPIPGSAGSGGTESSTAPHGVPRPPDPTRVERSSAASDDVPDPARVPDGVPPDRPT